MPQPMGLRKSGGEEKVSPPWSAGRERRCRPDLGGWGEIEIVEGGSYGVRR